LQFKIVHDLSCHPIKAINISQVEVQNSRLTDNWYVRRRYWQKLADDQLVYAES